MSTSHDAASALPGADDTIVAIATAAGRGALAVVRVSGRDAHAIAGRVVRPWPVEARRARLVAVHDPVTGGLLERPVVTVWDAPRTYTGEPMVELSTHGGAAAPAAVVAALVAAGAREALPGEVTRRAVLAGKMDLLQAEAVGDLIDARSTAMRRAALEQLDGGLSRRVRALRDAAIEIEALIAYDIDFPEEDDGPIPRARVSDATAHALGSVDALLATAGAGELVREGAIVVIAGPPNAGKSSLFNALLGRQRAIVTPVPGTTRDAIEATVDAGDWPLRLVDTAGLRETEDVVERLGIEVSERYLSDAQLVLACGESADGVRLAMEAVRARSEAPIIGVLTKRDSGNGAGEWGMSAAVASGIPHSPTPFPACAVSAETGFGLDVLVRQVGATLSERYGSAQHAETPLVTRARHRRALGEAREELAQFAGHWSANDLPAPVAAIHLRAAVHALEELIGGVGVEDVLERVFSAFCVGK